MTPGDERSHSWRVWWDLFVRENPIDAVGFGTPTDVEIDVRSSETLAFATVKFEKELASGAKARTEMLFEWEPDKGWRLVF